MKIVSRACADQRGFTLAELLVAVAILGLIMMGVLTLIMTGNQTYVTGSNQIEAQQGARAALERMAREIRGAGFNPQGALGALPCPPTNNCPIVGINIVGNPNANPTATSLLIQTDTNGDGVLGNAANERIAYTLNGTNLQRQDLFVDVAGPQTLMGGIQALQFTYLDANGNGGGPTQDIRSVQIQLTTRPENQPANATWQAGGVLVTMTDRIRVRNR